MLSPNDALDQLRELSKPDKAADMADYHKVEREYLGVSNPEIDVLYKAWRKEVSGADRVALAAGLWDSNIFEARVGAAKLFTQARIKPDDETWGEIKRWVTMFDSWAIADHACGAGARRLVAEPARLDEVETWTTDENMWVRRAALVMTLPWTKQNNPKLVELEERDRILGWAAGYVEDEEWFIQKAIAWWLRSLSKHDAPRVLTFLEQNGDKMKAFAVKEACTYL